MKVLETNTQGPSSRLNFCTLISPQIKNESFLEDINNVLNSGDIPNLYSADEQDQIVNTMRPYIQEQGLQPTKANLMAAYTGRVRSNIHVVLCMRYGLPWWPRRDGTWACHEEGPGLWRVLRWKSVPHLASWSPSPIGEVFRARLRQFPSLVNCCTIDWFNEWPAEALESVATMFLNEIPDLEATSEVIRGLVGVLVRSKLSGGAI